MIQGGCPWLAASGQLHDPYGAAPSQLAAAVAFLHAHQGRVGLVTVNIGSNDLLAIAQACGVDPGCVAQKVGNPANPAPGTLFGNLAAILASVRQAAPAARILVFNYYDPQVIDQPLTDSVLQPINGALVPFSAAFGAGVVDSFGTINQVYAVGGVVTQRERAGVCLLTWECTALHNIHPDFAGYWLLMRAMARTLG